MTPRHGWRSATLLLALAHSFPLRRHVAPLLVAPSWSEGWKTGGAALAIVFFLLPPRAQLAVLRRLARMRLGEVRLVTVVTLALCIAHVVPALDHVPRALSSASWADTWRGGGALLAAIGFALPRRTQGRVLAWCKSTFRRPLRTETRVRPLPLAKQHH